MPYSYDAMMVVDTVTTSRQNPNTVAKAYLVNDNTNTGFSPTNPSITCNKGDTVQLAATPVLSGVAVVISSVTNTGGTFPPMIFSLVDGAWMGTATQTGSETVTATIAIGGAFTPSGNNVTPNFYTFSFNLTVAPN